MRVSEAAGVLEGHQAELAEATLRRLAAMAPDQAPDAARRDVALHLRHLTEALAAEEPRLFRDYHAWFSVTSIHHGTPAEAVHNGFAALRSVLSEHLPEVGLFLAECFDERFGADEDAAPPFPPEGAWGELARQLLDALLRGERMRASRMVLDAVEEGTLSVRDAYIHVFQPVLREVGRLWETNRIGVGEEHVCTAGTQLAMSQLASHVLSSRKNGRVVVAASVSGELHEVGIRMVADFLEMEGWETWLLGASVPPESLVQTVVDRRAHVLALSATLALHVRRVHDLIARLRARRCAVKVLVGGHAFNIAPALAHRCGADAFARDAADAVAAAARLTS